MQQFSPIAYQFSVLTFEFSTYQFNLALIAFITNSPLGLIGLYGILIALFTCNSKAPIRFNLYQILFSVIYLGLQSIITKSLKSSNGTVPFLLALIGTILALNLLGLFSYILPLTSSIIICLYLSLTIFIANLLRGLFQYKAAFPLLFTPVGVPLYLLPLIIYIELISYFIKGFSLGIRLFANISAGHLLLLIISFFLNTIFLIFQVHGGALTLITFLSLAIIYTLILILELFVSMVQAYIFFVLTIAYMAELE
uniref:ATP synthase subunit a n=1 Tax=Clathrina clathrus TaxID=1031547 RepID=L0HQQ3_CLACL|nr:ATP synthase F0 subunit 6 [Clathrina clathrus]AGB07377.1 ATP synthase F0 subunit 6 [Clathrina clathrus]